MQSNFSLSEQPGSLAKRDSKHTICIAMVAGEASGDILGSALMHVLKRRHNNIRFVGIGGSKMIEAGFETIFPIERLSVFGISEVIFRLPELLRIRNTLKSQLGNHIKPSIFIGIDAPDFNIPLARTLKQQGICTIHYVSPSVWAWRPKRVLKIKEAVNHMLTLLPFEADFYKKHNVPVTFVGHTLADEMPMYPDAKGARKVLGIADDTYVVALLPGSRKGEVMRLLPLMLATAALLKKKMLAADGKKVTFLIPSANKERHRQIQQTLWEWQHLPVNLYGGMAQQVLLASDQVLVASGTATLETMMARKPMVVCYKEAWFTWCIIKHMLNTKWVALPNLLANKLLVPEFLQNRATPERLCSALIAQMKDVGYQAALTTYFEHFHKLLRKNASECAADVVDTYLSNAGQCSKIVPKLTTP